MSLAEPDVELQPPDDGPAFELRRLATLSGPVVFASPHSGRLYPASMLKRTRLSGLALRSSEDALVDRLIEPAGEHGAALFLALYARAYLDVNRELTELDPGMFVAPPPGSSGPPSARVQAGLGCIPRVVAEGREIYRERLPADEAERRIDQVWRPYHAGLDGVIGEARARFGRALLIDWHSMPAGVATSSGRGLRVPDIVLGDRFGRSCAPAIPAMVQRELEASGYTVVRNTPYAGGWTTERYGRPEAGVHALQIEVSRSLYLGASGLHPSRGFDPLRRAIERLTQRLVRAAVEMR